MNSLIESAAKQVLSEKLGFDEAKVYYSILTNKKKEIDNEFSYSKKYRILKSLYNIGAISKIKLGERDFYSYFILPPLFLNDNDEVSEHLYELYENNFKEKLINNFFQIIMRTSIDKFVDFMKGINVNPSEDKINFEFSKIRCNNGYEYIGSVEILGE